MQFMAKLHLWVFAVEKFSVDPQIQLYIEQNTYPEHELKTSV